MRKSFVPILALILMVTVIASLAGCGGAAVTPETKSTAAASTGGASAGSSTTAAAHEPITLGLYLGEQWLTNSVDPQWGNDPVAKKLKEKFNINFNITMTKSNDAENDMNILMASGDLPDLIWKSGGASLQRLINGGYLMPIDNFVEDTAKYPNIKKNQGMFLNEYRAEDGKLYYLGAWTWAFPSFYAVTFLNPALYMRYDILKELNYPKLERPENSGNSFITKDEYTALLAQVKEKYPDMILAIPDLSQSAQTYACILSSYGYPMYKDSIFIDGKAYYTYNNRLTEDILRYMYRLGKDGIFPKGFATLTREQNQASIAGGDVFSTMGNVPGMQEGSLSLNKDNEERRLATFYLTDNSNVKQVYDDLLFASGTPAVSISAETKYADRIMEFLDFCTSEEGSWLLHTGIEGIHYTMKDGKPDFNKELFDGYCVWSGDVLKKFGIPGWGNCFPTLAGGGEGNKIFTNMGKNRLDLTKYAKYDIADWPKSTWVGINSPWMGTISQEKYPDEFDSLSKIQSYVKDRFAKALTASTEEACIAEWNNTVEKMKADGVDKLNAAMDAEWNRMAKALGREPAKAILSGEDFMKLTGMKQ